DGGGLDAQHRERAVELLEKCAPVRERGERAVDGRERARIVVAKHAIARAAPATRRAATAGLGRRPLPTARPLAVLRGDRRSDLAFDLLAMALRLTELGRVRLDARLQRWPHMCEIERMGSRIDVAPRQFHAHTIAHTPRGHAPT